MGAFAQRSFGDLLQVAHCLKRFQGRGASDTHPIPHLGIKVPLQGSIPGLKHHTPAFAVRLSRHTTCTERV